MKKAVATAPGEEPQYIDLTPEEEAAILAEWNAPPKPPSLQEQLDFLFKQAPIEVQAAFWSLRLTVKDALIEDPTGFIAKFLIQNAPNVPPQYADIQAQMLSAFPED